IFVSVGIDRDGLNPQLARGFDDTTGNLAAVGDQNPFEHTVSATRPVGFAGNGCKCQFDIAPPCPPRRAGAVVLVRRSSPSPLSLSVGDRTNSACGGRCGPRRIV